VDPNLTANDVVMQIIVRNYFLSVNCCPSKCSFIIFTARLHVMQRTVLSRPFCLSVCLSDLFLVLVLNTQAKTAKLTTPIQQKFPQKIDFLLCLGGGVYLQLTPINYAQKFLSALGVYVHPVPSMATPVVGVEKRAIMSAKYRLPVTFG